ncbi:MAG TPA: hypothetical protein VM184_11305 [Gaiellaceae bacterium]|nr:hypothetical protein [Gaiellaceae bacterium]
MSRLPLLLATLFAAGCAGAAEPEAERAPPSWLEGEFDDGTIAFRHPGSWRRSSSRTFGTVLSDTRSRHPAFVSVRYLDDALPPTSDEYADLAGRTLRPPEGFGLTLVYTQTAYLGDVRGYEATFLWATREGTPAGPTMRTFAAELASGRVAFIVLAAERPRLHAGVFGWIRKTMSVAGTPGRAAGATIERDTTRAYGRFINEA